MAGTYIPRSLEPVIRRAAREFPVVVLTGPRQSGKTTLLKRLFGARYRYVSLEPPDVRAAAMSDPRGFLGAYPPPVILDEVQYAPDLLPYIKEIVDESRDEPGRFVLTGSQNLLLMERITESLAGRSAVMRLLPLSQREARREPSKSLPWERRHSAKAGATREPATPWREFLRGNYPELVAHPRRDLRLWHSSYVQTHLERDIRALRQIGDLTQFQNFLQALAARSGQLLNLATLGRDLGIALNTAKAWLSVLEATHQVLVLRPYFRNVGKRLVKTPKVYFVDVGTLCYLAGLEDPDHARLGPMAGPIFETAVVSEIVKTFLHRGREPRLSFWRTSTGEEVDLLVETEGTIIPIEAKVSATPRPQMAEGIRKLRRDIGETVAPGYVVHPGAVMLPLGQHAIALPFAAL